MALMLKSKDGISYWSDGNPLDATFPAALYGNIDGVFLPSDPTSPPIADVVCPRSITFTIPGKPSATVSVVEDGGNLDFTITLPGPKADISGLFFDFTNSKLSSLNVSGNSQITQFVTGANMVGNLTNGVNLNGTKVSTYDVGMEFGLAGIGSNHQNINLVTFALSDTAHDLTLDDLRPAQETGTVGLRDISGGQKLEAVAPFAPTDTPDTVTTLEDVSITIPASSLATDMNSGAILTISKIGSGFEDPQYGTVTIASDGKSLTYTPTTLDYLVDGILTGNQDAFQVCVTDNFGGEVTSFVTVNATPVADTPTLSFTVLAPHAGDPATLTRFLVTAQSGDYGTVNQGSDFIQSLSLSLGGNVTSGVMITDTKNLLSGNIFNVAGNNGFFTDEIDVTMPSSLSPGTNINDTLSVAAVNAETEGTGSPATASATGSQSINIDYSQANANPDFTTSGQNIWGPGNNFSFDYHKFLGISNGDHGFTDGPASGLKTFSAKLGGITTATVGSVSLGQFGATAFGTVGLKAGFQVDVSIDGGNWSASLPFSVTLNNVYNKTTDTLQVGGTDSAGTGTFNSTGPNGNADLLAIFQAMAKFGGQLCVVGCVGGSVTVPKFGTTDTLLKISTTHAQTSIDLGKGVTLSLTYPQVNTTGAGTATNVATPQVMAQALGLSVDVVALVLDILIGTDPLKGNVDGIGTYDLLSANLKAGLDLAQKFDLTDAGITADLLVGTTQTNAGPLDLTGGTPLLIQNVSSDGLNSNGTVPLALQFTLNNPQLQNITSLVPTAGASLTIGELHLSALGISFNTTVFKKSITVPLGNLTIFNTKFSTPAAFASQSATGLTAT